MLVVKLPIEAKLHIGALGEIFFRDGFYFYVGSAMGKNSSTTLENRIKRHLLNDETKKVHWHIDYLLKHKSTSIVKLFIVPSKGRLECILAQELLEKSESYIDKFGSSDCRCKSHLFYFKTLNEFKL